MDQALSWIVIPSTLAMVTRSNATFCVRVISGTQPTTPGSALAQRRGNQQHTISYYWAGTLVGCTIP
jgi:hypothetical protein